MPTTTTRSKAPKTAKTPKTTKTPKAAREAASPRETAVVKAQSPARSAAKRPAKAASKGALKGLKARYGGWALVAGSAEGMGAAYAERLAREGFDLVLLDMRQPELKQLAARLEREYGVQTRSLICDLTRPVRVEAMLDGIDDLEIGLLVFNAALAANGPWDEVTLETKLAAVNINVIAVLTIADRLSRKMLERGRGGIVLTSSMAALQGAPLQAVYASTKSFDLILAESLWGELGPRGVDVLAFIPGMVRTPSFQRSGAESGESRLLSAIEPDDAVEEALGALGRQPRLVPGRAWKAVAMAGNLVPRATMIKAVGERLKGLKTQR